LSLRIDEKLALAVLAIAAGGLIHAFSYTAAEGAHPSKRWVFHRAADMLGLVAAYFIVWVWL